MGLPIKVWDVPTRLFHWLLVLAVTGALITVNLGETWMHWHLRFGLAVIGLLGFRLVWGICGPSEARFTRFAATPQRLAAQWRGDWHGAGHTPLGSLSVLAMLALFTFQSVTGLFATDDVAVSGPWADAVFSPFSRLSSGWHRSTEELLYALIGVHVLAVVWYQLRGKRLAGAMLHGRKIVFDAAAPPAPASRRALALALSVGVIAVWLAKGF
ncbi:cytochrome b/b6 domain-containing protein [Halopseudomonas nanhaiensis]|uniref:cytochrome b/b6 domain-containing protein n=1 Tax=Halopseudomonas nanhaiensis TaxID=2830842 RepID=UPI001CBDDF4A|nr:cytochrome b/b6 domain-containing protein [Halopseudomonas nanhaiensis]UAW98451.1 cytochrome b/b6 domain-containing protein [Halopseudomonas nanhaiensis]